MTLAALLSLAAGEAPALIPTRDVDVTYDLPGAVGAVHQPGAAGAVHQPGAPGAVHQPGAAGAVGQPGAAGAALSERLRWDTQGHRLRVDPPGNGVYMITDYTTHRMSIVRDADRLVVEALAPAAALPGTSAAPYQRQGSGTVAGLACTDWATIDTEQHPVVVCVTADGVLLNVRRDARTLLVARRVTYGPQDAALFRVPADYRRTTAGRPQ